VDGSRKLKLKLQRAKISAQELRTLLGHEGWSLERTRGSHEVWAKGRETFVLATHDKELKM
jgi:predicted RNA binding protein YcfA (HicA-like mRNA interferase family)